MAPRETRPRADGRLLADCFHARPHDFAKFLDSAFELPLRHKLGWREKSAFLYFLINCFQSLEDPVVFRQTSRCVALGGRLAGPRD